MFRNAQEKILRDRLRQLQHKLHVEIVVFLGRAQQIQQSDDVVRQVEVVGFRQQSGYLMQVGSQSLGDHFRLQYCRFIRNLPPKHRGQKESTIITSARLSN